MRRQQIEVVVRAIDAVKAKAMPGVIDVVQIPDGVAVVGAFAAIAAALPAFRLPRAWH